MKKSILLAAAILLLTAALPATAEVDQCLTAPSGIEMAGELELGFEEGTVLDGTGLDSALPTAAAPPPPCPVDSDCTGPAGNGNTCSTNPANCGVSGPGTKTDLGLTVCQLPSGLYFRCAPGSTIHTKSAPCAHCPCCSTFPACLCPLDCGQVLRWGCA